MTSHRNTILHGDCVKLLPQIPTSSIDFVLTDPPYVHRYQSHDGRRVPNARFTWLKPVFAELYRVLRRHSFCVSFYGWRHAEKFLAAYCAAGFRIAGHLTFPKRYISGQRYLRYQHESAYLLAKGDPQVPEDTISDVIAWTTYTGNTLHPTQKPLSVLLPLVKAFSAPGHVVLDPFTGSGSSLLAARMLGRQYLGIELDATYHAIASRRLAQAQGTPAS